MKNIRSLAVFLAAIGLSFIAAIPNSPGYSQGPTPTRTPTVSPDELVPWEVNCENEDPSDGYKMPSWGQEFCVPGMITRMAQFCPSPGAFSGVMSSYAEGVMERVAKLRPGQSWSDLGVKGGAATMSCADVGKKLWIQLPGKGWYGPLLVVDCSGRSHYFYHVVQMGLAVEVDYESTKKLGQTVAGWSMVSMGSPNKTGRSYRGWWMSQCMEFETPEWFGITATPTATIMPTSTQTPTATPTITLTPTTVLPILEVEEQIDSEVLSKENITMTAEQLTIWVVGALLGVIEVPVFQWLKEKLGIEDKAAFVAVFVFSIVLALVALAVTGGFSPFDLNKMFEYLAAIVTLGQVTYRLLVKK